MCMDLLKLHLCSLISPSSAISISSIEVNIWNESLHFVRISLTLKYLNFQCPRRNAIRHNIVFSGKTLITWFSLSTFCGRGVWTLQIRIWLHKTGNSNHGGEAPFS